MKKKTVLKSLKDFMQNVQNIFPFSFSFSFENGKNEPLPLCPPFVPPFAPHFGGVSSAASFLKIWDAMPPYLKRLFEQKTEIW